MTSWTPRTGIDTSWGVDRLGGAYLKNSLGEYILTLAGERIIVIVEGGDLDISSWNTRNTINTNWL